jgi:hypothetical protein
MRGLVVCAHTNQGTKKWFIADFRERRKMGSGPSDLTPGLTPTPETRQKNGAKACSDPKTMHGVAVFGL